MKQPPDAETILRSLETRLRQFREAQGTGDALMIESGAWRIVFGALSLLHVTIGDYRSISEAVRRCLPDVSRAITEGRLVAPCPRCAMPAIADGEGNLDCLGCHARSPLIWTATPGPP